MKHVKYLDKNGLESLMMIKTTVEQAVLDNSHDMADVAVYEVIDDGIVATPDEVKILKGQIVALRDRNAFIEELIAEMAGTVYGE